MEDFMNQMNPIDTGMIAGDVGFDALESLMTYYPAMLTNCLSVISEMTGESIMDVKSAMERKLDLVGVQEQSMKQLTASRDVIGSLLEALGESTEE